jgi:hypothetical protein
MYSIICYWILKQHIKNKHRRNFKSEILQHLCSRRNKKLVQPNRFLTRILYMLVLIIIHLLLWQNLECFTFFLSFCVCINPVKCSSPIVDVSMQRSFENGHSTIMWCLYLNTFSSNSLNTIRELPFLIKLFCYFVPTCRCTIRCGHSNGEFSPQITECTIQGAIL